MNKVHEYTERFIRMATKYRESNFQETSEKNSGYVFLQELANSTEGKRKLRDELLTTLLAARDTTATVLGNLFFILARRPDVWYKLRSEVEKLAESPLTYDQLKRMDYVHHCLNECKPDSCIWSSPVDMHISNAIICASPGEFTYCK